MDRRSMVACTALGWMLAGCATILKGSQEKVTLDSDPRGAKVYLNGNPIGHTPTELQVSSKDTVTFEFRQDGFETRTVTIGHSAGAGWIVLDVLLPFWLINIVVDAVTGDWFYLDQNHVMVTLEPMKPEPRQTPAPVWVPSPPPVPPPPVPGT
jgi:hypothetical protein